MRPASALATRSSSKPEDREEKIAQMVERPGHLDAVGAKGAAVEPAAHIVHQHVQTWQAATQAGGEGADVTLRRQIGQLEIDHIVTGLGLESDDGPDTLSSVAAHDDHVRALPGESQGGHSPDAAGRAGHDADSSLHPNLSFRA